MISTIEESEIPQFYLARSIVWVVPPNTTNGTTFQLIAAGHHPRMRLVKAQSTATVYATAPLDITLEEEDGTDHATVASSATVFTPVDFTITDNVWESDESVFAHVTDQGSATNTAIVSLYFEAIH